MPVKMLVSYLKLYFIERNLKTVKEFEEYSCKILTYFFRSKIQKFHAYVTKIIRIRILFLSFT